MCECYVVRMHVQRSTCHVGDSSSLGGKNNPFGENSRISVRCFMVISLFAAEV